MVDTLSALPPRRPELVRNETANRSEAVREHSVDAASSAPAQAASPSSSAASSLLDRAKEAAAHTPEVDRQHVDDIKRAIARGEFQVNPKAVAQAFVTMTLNATR